MENKKLESSIPNGSPPDVKCEPQNFFGRTLKEIRTEKGLTQQDAAALMHITQAQWSAYEVGKSSPNLDMILAIAAALQIHPFDLINRSLEKSKFFSPTNNSFPTVVERLRYPSKAFKKRKRKLKPQETII